MTWVPGGESNQDGSAGQPISRGIVLEGKYRVMEQLGRGNMGTVFRAVDEFLDREVAIKFLLPQFQADPSFTARFTQEARALASVRHNNVLEIYSFGTYGRMPFFVMEYIRGVTMSEVVKAGVQEGRRILVREALKVISQTCSGLGAVHRADAVHRDIKPANLMVQANTRRVILMDFGLGQRAKPSESKIDSWMPGGTPAYMAPELFLERQLDIWEAKLADIYALGATAYELLTGELPVTGKTWFDLMRRHLKDEPPPLPSSTRADLPRGLDEVLMRTLSKNPSLRYQRCEELQQALLPFVRSHSVLPEDAEMLSHDSGQPPPRLPPQAQEPEVERELSGIRSHRRYDKVKRAGVLVADPDPSFRTQVLVLASEIIPGCNFNAARTNSSALELARRSPPAIILAALYDSRMNGLELAGLVREDERLRDVKVILSAERITAQDRDLLKQMGVVATVLKTQESAALEAALEAGFRAALDG